MSWCAKCRAEHADDLTLCPDCGGELLAEVPEEDDLVIDEEWVTVAERTGLVLRQLIKSELENAGIPCSVSGADAGTTLIYPAFDTKIQVPKSHEEEARQIVEDMLKSATEQLVCSECGAAVSVTDKVCPNCGESFDEEFGAEKVEVLEGEK